MEGYLLGLLLASSWSSPQLEGNFLGRSGEPARIVSEGCSGFFMAFDGDDIGLGADECLMPNPRCNKPELGGLWLRLGRGNLNWSFM